MSKKYTVARISIRGKTFEILVKPDPALSYRRGKSVPLSDVLVADVVYSDANKGFRVSEDDLQKAFGTRDIRKIADVILRRGTLQLTADQRRRMIEEKRRQIITFISKQCVDPRTKLPHPPLRIQQALEQVHFSVDPFREVEEQANEAIALIRSVLPISTEKISVSVKIPARYVGKAYGAVKSFGSIRKETWHSDGSWSAVVEMPAGLYGPFLEKIGETTRGNAEAEILK
ncbi:MAG: RNA-associated protein [Candidatus Bathyarchaeota archaeon B63]|nr:MAG: RNA-associated protein [Candidatus Bathyarchaeota archaeon B63]